MKAASLTSSLLAPKGAAAPSGIAPPVQAAGDDQVQLAPEHLEHDQKTLRQQVAALTTSFGRESAADKDAAEANTPASRVSDVVKRAAPQRKRTSAKRARGKRAASPKLDDLGRIKMSLRLDEKRHLMLKLAAAHLNKSAQELLVEALDGHLNKLAGDISCSQFSALVKGGAGHVHDSSCWAKKA
ncbi:hypothetical protein [Pelagibius sp. Alg239-R121]|uniref:hypothetical protein n=1 Tax=Pelagibius sp. Alg239-R121 TaxID=2993448 RepID=UPI0024A7187F|nr:hypothetical protein [Pelagibius sp. Alg239-R121]